MATKTYLPTRDDQEATNSKIDALAATTAKTATASALETAQASLDEANEKIDALQSQIDTMEKSAGLLYANITVRFNWEGQTYDAPTDASVLAELLNGAKLVLDVAGDEKTYEVSVTSFTNFSMSWRVPVTAASRISASKAYVILGESTSAAYVCSSDFFYLRGGDDRIVYINSVLPVGDKVVVFRAQPYTDNPSSSSDEKLRFGASYLGIKIINSTGTTTHLGYWDESQGAWVNQSYTKVSLWDVTKNSDGTAGTITERVISEGAADFTNWMPLEERLNCLKNIKIGTLSFTDGSTTASDNKIVRFDPVWVKQKKERMNMRVKKADGTFTTNEVWCIVRYYANEQVDNEYHLLPLFEKYVRNATENTYTATPCAHGYIARYPIGGTVDMTIDGEKKAMPLFKANGSAGIVGNRQITLDHCRRLNKVEATLTFDGETPITIRTDSTNRTWGVAGTAEISFLQWMAYLYFGINVQGAANNNDFDENTFPGICTSAVGQTGNGATDFIVAADKPKILDTDTQIKIYNGAINTRSTKNSIVFCGVEDALWSSQGWYWEDLTFVLRRTYVTNANGVPTVTGGTITRAALFAQDAADVDPLDIQGQNERTDNDDDSIEGKLKLAGYRGAEGLISTGNNTYYRAAVDTTTALRDVVFGPSADSKVAGLNIGGKDYYWGGNIPSAIAAFSTTTDYAVGDYCLYNNALYKCSQSHTAGAWEDADFTLMANATVTCRSYYSAGLSYRRHSGAYLGAFCVPGFDYPSWSNSDYWRARPFLSLLARTFLSALRLNLKHHSKRLIGVRRKSRVSR